MKFMVLIYTDDALIEAMAVGAVRLNDARLASSTRMIFAARGGSSIRSSSRAPRLPSRLRTAAQRSTHDNGWSLHRIKGDVWRDSTSSKPRIWTRPSISRRSFPWTHTGCIEVRPAVRDNRSSSRARRRNYCAGSLI